MIFFVGTALGIEHLLPPPRHPPANEMVEGFNGRIAEVIKPTRFKFVDGLEATIGGQLHD